MRILKYINLTVKNEINILYTSYNLYPINVKIETAIF